MGDVRQTSAKFLPSADVKVTIEKTTYIFLPSFPLDIGFTENRELNYRMDLVSVQIQEARNRRQMGMDIASGGVKDIMLAEGWLPSQLLSQTKCSCMCWNLYWDISLSVTSWREGYQPEKWGRMYGCLLSGWNLVPAKIITVNNLEGIVHIQYVDYGSISWCK